MTMDLVMGTPIQSVTPLITTAAGGAVILAAAVTIFRRRDF